MIDLNQEELADLLRAAAEEHGKYEKEELGGEYDKNWPDWYAKWILDKQNKAV